METMMEQVSKSRAWAEINLDAIAHNIQQIRKKVGPSVRVLAVVKADAYGHGYKEVAKTLLENGADAFGVATIDEAIQLRRQKIRVPILILGHTPVSRAQDLVTYDITPTVFDMALPKALSGIAGALGKEARIHIKLDTGMTRLGFDCDDAGLSDVLAISRLPHVYVEGIFTHFAKADELDKTYTRMQFQKFMEFTDRLKAQGLDIPIKHVCNSAGVMDLPEMYLDMVRPGIILYGQPPSCEVDRAGMDLWPAMELRAVVTHIHKVDRDTRVSYGGTFTTGRPSTIATIPIGYADGYMRSLSNRAQVIVRGQKVPVIGRICMDQCMLDVTDVNTITVGDEVILFGKWGDLEVSVTELADLVGTIGYELLCVIGKRIPRVYLKQGEVLNVLSYME